jgi:hypothetical protein
MGTLPEETGQWEPELGRDAQQRWPAESAESTGVHARQSSGHCIDAGQGLIATALAAQSQNGGEQLGQLPHQPHDEVSLGDHRLALP